jgi:hypothetical protein
MPFVFKRLALFLSITAAFAADKEPPPFKPASASSFANHQTNGQVTIGVDPYVTDDKVPTAFGKVNPYQYGVLPVLVVIQNDSDKTIKLNGIKAQYVGPSNDRIDATPARDVRFLQGPNRPNLPDPSPAGRIKGLKKKKNPLDAWEIEGRAFSAAMLPPGQSASGFFYFQADVRHGSTIYLSGLTEAGTGKELFYFEIPLQ